MVVRSPEGADLDAATLIAWSRERLGRHKYPRRVEFVDALPLGPSARCSSASSSRASDFDNRRRGEVGVKNWPDARATLK